MSAFNHVTVLLNETVKLVTEGLTTLDPNPNGRRIWADCTLGGAGHTLLLLEGLTQALNIIPDTNFQIEHICCDQDPHALKIATERIQTWQDKQPSSLKRVIVTPLSINFRNLPEWLRTHRHSLLLSGLIADLGVSSPQIDSPERGFSFLREGPLDMRMNPDAQLTALELLSTWEADELRRIFDEYGEEPRARALARAIVQDRSKGLVPLSNTVEFANYVSRVLGYHQSRVHPATRIFQALRIAVNEELAAVEELLSQLPRIMAADSIAGFISFHSLEDRLVKRYFRAWEQGDLTPEAKRASDKRQWTEAQAGLFGSIDQQRKTLGSEYPRGGIVANEEEIQQNPRSRSARLRGFRFAR